MLLTEIRGHEPFPFFEDPVEIGETGKPAFLRNLRNRAGRVDQQTRRMSDADIIQVIHEGDPCLRLEEPAERCLRHLRQLGCFGKPDPREHYRCFIARSNL